MLSNTLVTNEVKNAAGTEVEFSRISTGPGRKTEFKYSLETPNLEHRLKVSHLETGSGSSGRRRSMVRFDKDVAGVSGLVQTVSAYCVVDIPNGDIADTTEVKNVLAELMSFLATTGAATAVLFDCTGNGASVLVNGEI